MSEDDLGDINTSDGKIYTYSTTLNAGSHNYSFSCSDGTAVNSTGLYTGLNVYVNNPPSVSNPDPVNNSLNVDLSQNTISVTITDIDGHLMNWSIETSPDIGNNSSSNDVNGSKSCSISGLSYDNSYNWYVNVSDGYNWTNNSFVFSTSTDPYFIVSDLYPDNNSINIPLQPNLYATFNRTSGSVFNISWYYGLSSGNETNLIDTDNNINNGTYTVLFYQVDNYTTFYYWRVWLNDGVHHVNYTYSFKTKNLGAGVMPQRNSIAIMAMFSFVLIFVFKNQNKNNDYRRKK